MDPNYVQVAVDLGREVLYYAFIISLPLLGAGMIVGVLISLLQAATQIQEQTLTFVPKIVAVILTLFLGLPWFMQQMLDFTRRLFRRIPHLFV